MSNLKSIINTRKQMFDERDNAGNIPVQLLGVRIPVTMHQDLKVRAAQRGETMASAVQEAIHDYLEKTQPTGE